MPISEHMTARELAKFLRVNQATIYRLLKSGQLPGYRVGSEWRFDRAVIERWLREAEKGKS